MNHLKTKWDKAYRTQDYYPFGMPMPGRTFSLTNDTSYRFGFNGKEDDNDIEGKGNSLDFGDRIYDPRLGRWLSVDPSEEKFAAIGSYVAFGSNPLYFIDPDGSIIKPASDFTQKVIEARLAVVFGNELISDQFFNFNDNATNGTDVYGRDIPNEDFGFIKTKIKVTTYRQFKKKIKSLGREKQNSIKYTRSQLRNAWAWYETINSKNVKEILVTRSDEIIDNSTLNDVVSNNKVHTSLGASSPNLHTVLTNLLADQVKNTIYTANNKPIINTPKMIGDKTTTLNNETNFTGIKTYSDNSVLVDFTNKTAKQQNDLIDKAAH